MFKGKCVEERPTDIKLQERKLADSEGDQPTLFNCRVIDIRQSKTKRKHYEGKSEDAIT